MQPFVALCIIDELVYAGFYLYVGLLLEDIEINNVLTWSKLLCTRHIVTTSPQALLPDRWDTGNVF